jgi:hypothetical protein
MLLSDFPYDILTLVAEFIDTGRYVNALACTAR